VELFTGEEKDRQRDLHEGEDEKSTWVAEFVLPPTPRDPMVCPLIGGSGVVYKINIFM
jgi:hypothetical protein